MLKMFNLYEKIMYGTMFFGTLLAAIVDIIQAEWSGLPYYWLIILALVSFYLKVSSMYNNYIKPVKEGKK